MARRGIRPALLWFGAGEGHPLAPDAPLHDVEETEPEMEFGVFAHLQWLVGLKDQFADAYVYLPPGLMAGFIVLNTVITASVGVALLLLRQRASPGRRLGGLFSRLQAFGSQIAEPPADTKIADAFLVELLRV